MKLQWKMLRRGQNSEIEGIIKFMKEQCIRYDNILTNSKVRIRTDLIEKTTELKRCMQKDHPEYLYRKNPDKSLEKCIS